MQIVEKPIVLGQRWLKYCSSSFFSAYVSTWCVYFLYKWGCKKVNWNTNSFLPAPFEPWEKKKYLSVSSCSCARVIHYTSSILYFTHFSLTTFLVPINKLFNSDNYYVYWCHYDHWCIQSQYRHSSVNWL